MVSVVTVAALTEPSRESLAATLEESVVCRRACRQIAECRSADRRKLNEMPCFSQRHAWPRPCLAEVMRLAIDTLDVGVADEVLHAANGEVTSRLMSSVFAGVRDVRLRLRQAKGALLCVAVVGFASGELVTSTATSETPLEAIVGALDGLSDRMDRVHRSEPRSSSASIAMTSHAAVRQEIKRLLATASG
jgi:hypothetical protein